MTNSRRRLMILASTVIGLATAGTVWASGASAHVTVAAPGVAVGASDAAITFRVPTESASASTIGLKLQLPIDHPIAGVLVAAQPGWTAAVKQTKLTAPLHTDDGDITEVVSEIDWKADAGTGIKPGYFGQFTILAGKLPDGVTTLVFKAIQSYSDNSTVSWIEQPAPGSSAQPEHPAPTLTLPASSNSPSGSASVSPSASATSPSVAATATTSAPSAEAAKPGASKGAATIGIVLGAVGVILGGAALFFALRNSRRRPQL